MIQQRISVAEGAAVAFSNVGVFHRATRMTVPKPEGGGGGDESKQQQQGTEERKILAFFFVNPSRQITSTASVPLVNHRQRLCKHLIDTLTSLLDISPSLGAALATICADYVDSLEEAEARAAASSPAAPRNRPFLHDCLWIDGLTVSPSTWRTRAGCGLDMFLLCGR